jgi:WD40 repeat protein
MKRPWSRGEKWLVATPLLFGIVALGVAIGPRVWRDASGYPIELPITPGPHVSSLSLSGDGRLLAAGEFYDNRPTVSTHLIRLWDARTLEPLPPLKRRAGGVPLELLGVTKEDLGAFQVALSPDARTLAWSIYGGGSSFLDLKSKRTLWSVPKYCEKVAFSPDSQWVALGGWGKSFRIVQARTGKTIVTWTLRPRNGEPAFQFSPRGDYFASTGARADYGEWGKAPNESGGDIELRRVSDWKVEGVLPLPNAEVIAFSPDGRSLIGQAPLYDVPARGGIIGTRLRCFDVSSGRVKWELDTRKPESDSRLSFVQDVSYSPDGALIAAMVMRSEVFLLDANSGMVKRTLRVPGHQNYPSSLFNSLVFSPDGKRLFARGKSAVLVWDLN